MTPQDDAEQTRVAPRFDATAAQTAQPVVPLTTARAHAPRSRTYLHRATGSKWPLVLLALGLLTVVGGATALYRQRPNTPQAATVATTPLLPAADAQPAAPERSNTPAHARIERAASAAQRARPVEREAPAQTDEPALDVRDFGPVREILGDDTPARPAARKARKHKGRDKHDDAADDAAEATDGRARRRARGARQLAPILVDVLTGRGH